MARQSVERYLQSDFARRARAFGRVVGATLLQDMRTRFGAGYLGYLFAVLWPLSHLCVLTTAYWFRTAIAPVGDSATVFVATGVVPYILCLYPGRMMGLAVQQNRQLLHIPLLEPFHLMIARCILEMLNAMTVLALFVLGLSLLDVEIVPDDPVEAAKAVAASVFLGVGFGFFNASMCAIVGPHFLAAFVFLTLALYVFSGVYIPAWTMPETIRDYLDYNPLLHLVEWLRSAYYSSYDEALVDKTLVLGVAASLLALGLAGERFLRGRFYA